MLEAIVNGRYYWIPVYRVLELRVEAPADLRDKVWMPAHFLWSNGGEAVGLIPTRYPGSESSPDAQILLARATQWNEAAPDLYLGLGQRLLSTDSGEHGIMDVRSIQMSAATLASDQMPAPPAPA
jgi:type VI secretion system protein ImpE